MTSGSRFLIWILLTFLGFVENTGAQNTPPYFIYQPAYMVNQTLQANPSTWQAVMQEVTWWPNTFLFQEKSTLTVNIPCYVGGTGPITCTWYAYNGTLSLSSTYTQLSSSTYTMSAYNGGTNCQLTVPVTAAALSNSFFCSAISTATNIPANSDTVGFIVNPAIKTTSNLITLVTYTYTYIANSAASGVTYPLFNSWYGMLPSACQGAVCTSSFDPSRFITDDQGTLHMIALQASDIQSGCGMTIVLV
jgi:hypothetical protein